MYITEPLAVGYVISAVVLERLSVDSSVQTEPVALKNRTDVAVISTEDTVPS
jgi:hypothetical protein